MKWTLTPYVSPDHLTFIRVVAKPISGVMSMVSDTAEGIRSSVAGPEGRHERTRRPRHCIPTLPVTVCIFSFPRTSLCNSCP
jgi:hypothetical protein